jgi:hypothetical protein
MGYLSISDFGIHRGPGTNSQWIPRENCILIRRITEMTKTNPHRVLWFECVLQKVCAGNLMPKAMVLGGGV